MIPTTHTFALQGGRRVQHMPNRLVAGITWRWSAEVEGNEVMTLVGNHTRSLCGSNQRVLWRAIIRFAVFTFTCIEDLSKIDGNDGSKRTVPWLQTWRIRIGFYKGGRFTARFDIINNFYKGIIDYDKLIDRF